MRDLTELPAPLVAIEVDLRDFAFMPLDVVRLRDSDLASMSDGEAFRAAVLLWCASWHQVPAASLPNDDRSIAMLAGFGRDVKGWRKIAAEALRGFVLCSDGRIYHRVVAEKANQAWDEKQSYRARREQRKQIAAHAAKARWAGDGQSVTDASSNASSMHEASAEQSIQDDDGNAERDRDRDRDRDTPIVPIRDEAFEEAWVAFPTQRKGARDKAAVAWRQAFRRHSGLDPAAVLAGISRYSRSDEVARGFAKGMAAWLNDDRWTADYAVPKADAGYRPVGPRPQADDWAKDIDLG